ncbi:MAG: hypothetical protein LRZ93_04840, partial [Clostridiales bacterium]|nr:hypothetical protein [Clostridiales bacterium]
LAFIFIAKDKLIKLLLVALQVLLLINLWGTKSRIAIIAVLLSLILMILFFRKKLFERKTVVRFSFLVVVSLMLAMHLGLLENAIQIF